MAQGKEDTTAPDQEPHPLEGKYLVFKYTEVDYWADQEQGFMLVYRILSGKLQGIVTPLQFGDEEIDDKTLAELERQGITEVTTVNFRGTNLLGLEYGTFELDTDEEYDEEIGVLNWSELEYVDPNDNIGLMLRGAGINLVYVDMRSDEIRRSEAESEVLISTFLGIPEN